MSFGLVDFNLFHDSIGKTLISLVRTLTTIRANGAQFRRGDHFFYGSPTYASYVDSGLLLFSRTPGNVFSLVAVNFTHTDSTAAFTFPVSGPLREEISATAGIVTPAGVLPAVTAQQAVTLTIPSNYGCIWTVTSA